MGAFEAVIIGLVQGLTEFLPISSDGHLAIAGYLLGMKELSLVTVVFVHAGTLVATLLVLRRELAGLLESALVGDGAQGWFSPPRRELLGIALASIPTVVIGLGLEPYVEAWSHDPRVVGACMLLTAGVLLTTLRVRGDGNVLRLRHYVIVGVAQGLAVLPGLSRSGSTIAVAMALGLAPAAAFRFSFLLSLPAVGGALLLELAKPSAWQSLEPTAAVAGAVALVTGVAALLGLRRVVSRGRFWAFAVYVAPVGLALLGWGFMRAPG